MEPENPTEATTTQPPADPPAQEQPTGPTIEQLEAAQAQATGALTALRSTMVTGMPDELASTVTGSTVEELQASHQRAVAIRDAVAKSVGASPPAVPTGARSAPTVDVSQLSPSQKIRHGLEHRNGTGS